MNSKAGPPQNAPNAAVECDIIPAWLFVTRQTGKPDVIYAYQPDMPKLLDILAKYLGESDINSVREIVGETEQRIERFNNEHQ